MEENNPLVSICMPAYNADKYIGETINSIVDQTYKNWELIIVNDGSTDNTINEIDKFIDTRIKCYTQKNKGQCAAANTAYSYSKGKLIKFMDADDKISPSFIENQVNCIRTNEDVIAFASWGRFYNDDIKTFKIEAGTIKVNMPPFEWLIQSMTGKHVMLQCSLWLIPRSILDQSGLWDESLSLINDFEFFIRVLLKAKEIRYTENAILYYRSGISGSLSSSKSREAVESAFNSISRGTQYLLNYENSERVRQIVANCFQYLVYEFYPNYKDLIYLSKERVADLGGSNFRFESGGKTKILVNIIGWRMTKKIKFAFSKLLKNIVTKYINS